MGSKFPCQGQTSKLHPFYFLSRAADLVLALQIHVIVKHTVSITTCCITERSVGLQKKQPSTNLHIHLQGRSIGPMLQQSPSGSKTKKRVFPCLLITPFSVFPEQRVVTTYHRLSASPAPTGVPSYGGGGSGWLRPLRGMLRD